ncbi:MAG: peptide deformylase [Omnitrophica bacterium RIFCSPHIGHO2_02_FULL_46_11]|nr:MAG: peptide deformylase [Omnitrophica bacterium RIFCSPLOWO2_01_FULL_45_10b]OGW87418.1 MAG: peptide deformylase [Omnitrophica bacterium RIFCSPHIGHO2_02_FULL_46_11]
MALLKVLEYPNPILTKKASLVSKNELKSLRFVQDMIDTMYHEDGVGLAAPQVAISKRIIVVSPDAQRGKERIYINPEIVESSKEEEIAVEGCLSLPGISCEVRRAKKIKLRSWDLNGAELAEEFENFSARVVQHEIDHLNGILLIDRVDFNRRQALLGSYRRL